MKEKIIKVLDEYGVKHQDFPDYIKIKCIFHDEKTPSLFVYINTNSYYCFGCGSFGKLSTLVSRVTGQPVTDIEKDYVPKVSPTKDDYTKQVNAYLSKAIFPYFDKNGPTTELLNFMVFLDTTFRTGRIKLGEGNQFIKTAMETLKSIQGAIK